MYMKTFVATFLLGAKSLAVEFWGLGFSGLVSSALSFHISFKFASLQTCLARFLTSPSLAVGKSWSAILSEIQLHPQFGILLTVGQLENWTKENDCLKKHFEVQPLAYLARALNTAKREGMTEKGVGRRKPLTCRRSGVLGIVRDYQRPIVIMRALLLSFGWLRF